MAVCAVVREHVFAAACLGNRELTWKNRRDRAGRCESRGGEPGWFRVEAATLLELETVPCRRIGHLNAEPGRADILADNKLPLNAGRDEELLGGNYKSCSVSILVLRSRPQASRSAAPPMGPEVIGTVRWLSGAPVRDRRQQGAKRGPGRDRTSRSSSAPPCDAPVGPSAPSQTVFQRRNIEMGVGEQPLQLRVR